MELCNLHTLALYSLWVSYRFTQTLFEKQVLETLGRRDALKISHRNFEGNGRVLNFRYLALGLCHLRHELNENIKVNIL